MWEIKDIEDKNIWEDFLSWRKEKTFLQSWNWGEFQELMKNKVWRWGIYNKEELLAVCLTTLINSKRGKYLLIQHGPIVKNENSKNKDTNFKILESLLLKLKEIAKKERAIFIRIASLFERTKDNIEIFKNLGFKDSPMHASAYEATLKLDITLSEEELLKKMRKTTRYLIRQVQKNENVKIEKSNNLADINFYQDLNLKVAKRQKFVPFSFEYIKNEFQIFLKDNQVLLFFGKYQNEVAAAALVIFWSGIAFYHQAASDSRYAKFSIPYLVIWEAIKEAQKRNCYLFDFWGYVNPQKNPFHPWAGPTLFKMGFGGQSFEYIKTQDFPLSKKYYLVFVFEKLRKIKRGL